MTSLQQMIDRLRSAGQLPAHEAEQLLAHCLGCSRARLILDPSEPTSEQWDLAMGLAGRRSSGEPLQYLIGWVPFLNARIEVGPGVLIPRPETELLAQTALELWHGMGSPVPRVALDVGTGSGCIALGLALAEPWLRVIGLELSDEALAWARRNVERNGAGGNVELYRSELFGALEDLRFPEHGASLVISNPPYVSEEEARALPREVADHEPVQALVSPAGGLAHLERIIAEAPRWLASPGLLALEIGETQHHNALALMERTGAFARVELRADLAGKPRMIFGWC